MTSPVRSVALSALVLSLLSGCAGEPPASPEEIVIRGAKGGNGPKGSDDPTVEAADPSSAPQDTTLEVRVLGSNYDRGSKVDFLLDGTPTANITTNSTRFVNDEELRANITIAAFADTTAYDIQVTTSRGKKGVGIESFHVTSKKPPLAGANCDADSTDAESQIALRITLRDSPGDSLRSDGGGPYEEGTDGAVHISSANLMFWIGDADRHVSVDTSEPFHYETTDRIYTNEHDNPGGDSVCGLRGMVVGSTGTANLSVELDDQGIVHYGKDCGDEPFPFNRVVITHPTDDTWTITGQSGLHCRSNGLKGKRAGRIEVGTAGPFQMELEKL